MNIYVCEFFKKLKIESKLQAPVLSTNSNMHKNGVLHTNLIFQGVKNFAQSSTKFVGMIFNPSVLPPTMLKLLQIFGHALSR